jgi:hypothetical protein
MFAEVEAGIVCIDGGTELLIVGIVFIPLLGVVVPGVLLFSGE